MNPMLIAPLLFSLIAQDAPPASQPHAPQPASEDVLAGPQVRETKSQPTLLQRGFDGRVEELEGEVEIEAVALLELSDEQKAVRDRIVAERNAVFDECVRRNYALIVELASMQGSDDQDQRAELLGRLRDGFQPFFQRGTFLAEFQDHLTDPQREMVNHLVNEYRMVMIDEVRKQIGPRANSGQAAMRIRLDGLGRMIRQSIERQVSLEREEFERISEELGLTPEQQGKAQAIFQPLAVKQLQSQPVSAAERRAALREFNRILTREQRWKMLGLIAERILPKAAASQPARE